MFLSLPAMDEDNDEINSFQLEEAFNSKCFYLNKKRKTRAEQLGLPISKHKCLDHRFPLKTSKIFEEKDLITCIITGNAERQAIDEGSDPESAKDSNSFVEDSDFAMSVDGEAKFEMEVSKIWPPDRPSTSSFSCNSLKDAQYSSDSAAAARHAGKEELTFVKGKELDDILYSNGVNPNVYALSSGRWLSTKKLSQAPENQPLIKNLSSTFPCLCCDSEHLYLELEANDF
ncbi:hypothetical protein H0E87_026738 [Populus deltoides]|uniref:Uncharacterized protein n=1 Tax=Populus deltoides TaxID=3696 RepID=A0A8T2WZB2_POPDE|nr:hypothetical protein H0E87_026738 [Populus deltoides]